MLKLKLTFVLGLLFALTLALTITLLFGTQKSEYYFDLNQKALNTLNTQLELMDLVDQYFYQQLTSITLGTPNTDISANEIWHAVTELRNSQHNKQGLPAIEQLEQIIRLGMEKTIHAHKLLESGERQKAIAEISDLYNQLLQNRLRPLIEKMADEQRLEAEIAADEENHATSQLTKTATTISQLALLASIIIGIYLYRTITLPLSQLTAGANAIREGQLGHQIQALGDDEFIQLAKQFNSMSSTLKQQHDTLRELNRELEQQVEERTEELRQANESLRRVDAMRAAFFADISHELRTPLTIIRGEAEVTLRKTGHDESIYRDVLKQTVDLTIQLNRLVDDLFYLSRAQTGGVSYEKEPVSLDGLIKECALEIATKMEQLELRLNANIQQSKPLEGDKGRLKQLIHILLDNACKYSPPKGLIELELTNSADYVTITVKDQGIGILEEDLEKVFERHYRGKNAQKLAKEGGGLGLPLAKAIVQSHGGEITINSKSGQGTTVTITLPYETMR